MIRAPVLLNLIVERARLAPADPAVREVGEIVTYGDFARHILRVCARLSGVVEAGDMVGLAFGDSYLGWVVLFAIARLGGTSFDLSGTTYSDVVDQLGAIKILTDSEVPERTGAAALRVDKSVLSVEVGVAPPPRSVTPDTPARVVFTSGTTGRKKAIVLTHAMLDARLPRYVSSYGMGEKPRSVSLIRPSSSPGFHIAMATWAQGGVMLGGPASRAVAEDKPGFIMATPMALQGLLDQLPPEAQPDRALRILVVGSALQPTLTRALLDRLAGDVTIRYGATEASSVTSGPAALDEGLVGAAGYVMPGAELEILGPGGAVLPPGQVGEIRTRSPGMASGYLRDPAETARRFIDGWFHPGDLGSLSEDGLLRIHGRVDDIFNVNGEKVSALDVENTVAKVEGVHDAGACLLRTPGGSGEVVVGVVLAKGLTTALVAQQIRGVFPVTVQLVSLAKLPRTETGKLQHRVLALHLASLSKGRLVAP